MRSWMGLALVAACGTKPVIPSGDDVGDTGGNDTVDPGDTVVETADTGVPVDTDETDVETDVPVPSWTITGKALCVDGLDDLGNVIHGEPAVPRTVRVIPGPGMFCRPLGGGCERTQDFLIPLAAVDADSDGTFSLTFEAPSLEGLYLFTDSTVAKPPGNCGSGYQFTEITLEELQSTQGFDDIDVDVYSVFFLGG
ncbi:MAG: hypothetical protein H6732_15205 [Alphaproteobacteria bacterium]|nr:hypothetical protein [Alphaproteobacteria bacterium]